jgi:uncharacterized protein (DUF362 family)
MTLSRRKFIGSALAAGATMAVSSNVFAQSATSKSEVLIGKGAAADVIPKIFEKLGGASRFFKPGARVLIKPNMSFSNPPDWGTGTSPEAVRAAVKLCLDAGASRVIVCDNTLHDAAQCKISTGIADAIKDLKGAVIFTPKQDSMFITKTDPRAKELRTVDVVREVYQADFILSLPTAKSHSAGGVSFNIKGLMGLVKNRDTFHRDMDLHLAIAEQLYYIKPHLCLVDASRALIDNGPAGPGKVIELKTFVAGTDPVAVDSYSVTLASWYGKTFEGKQVKHIKEAAALGFGNIESSMITEIAV